MRAYLPPLSIAVLMAALLGLTFASPPLAPNLSKTSNTHSPLTTPIQPSVTTGLNAVTQMQTPDYSPRILEAAARPLFTEQRRPTQHNPVEQVIEHFVQPPVEEELETLEISAKPPDIQLRGYLNTNFKPRALVYEAQLGTERWVYQGERIAEWEISEISASHIKIVHEQQVHIVEIVR